MPSIPHDPGNPGAVRVLGDEVCRLRAGAGFPFHGRFRWWRGRGSGGRCGPGRGLGPSLGLGATRLRRRGIARLGGLPTGLQALLPTPAAPAQLSFSLSHEEPPFSPIAIAVLLLAYLAYKDLQGRPRGLAVHVLNAAYDPAAVHCEIQLPVGLAGERVGVNASEIAARPELASVFQKVLQFLGQLVVIGPVADDGAPELAQDPVVYSATMLLNVRRARASSFMV